MMKKKENNGKEFPDKEVWEAKKQELFEKFAVPLEERKKGDMIERVHSKFGIAVVKMKDGFHKFIKIH